MMTNKTEARKAIKQYCQENNIFFKRDDQKLSFHTLNQFRKSNLRCLLIDRKGDHAYFQGLSDPDWFSLVKLTTKPEQNRFKPDGSEKALEI